MNSWELAEKLNSLARLARYTNIGIGSNQFLDASTTIRHLDVDEVEPQMVGFLLAQGLLSETTASAISEVIKTGNSSLEQTLLKKIPKGVQNLLQVSGLSIPNIVRLYEDCGIETLEELRKASRGGLLSSRKGFGERFSRQVEGMVTQTLSGRRTLPLSNAIHLANLLQRKVKHFEEASKVFVAGDIRRGRELIEKIDLLVVVSKPTIKTAQEISKYLEFGERNITKYGCEGQVSGIQVRVYLCRPEYIGSAMCLATGPGDHYQKLCSRTAFKNRSVAGFLLIRGDEESFYKQLGLPYIPPEIREWPDCIELSEGKLSWDLVEEDDILGDLHAHTPWSDGRSRLSELVRQAEQMGLEYLTVTDHAQGISVIKGLSARDLEAQTDKIRKMNAFKGTVKIVPGIEYNIDADGHVDFQTRQKIMRIGALHSGLGDDPSILENRYLRAISSGAIDIVAHPTLRRLLVRPPIEIDWDMIFSECSKMGVAVELNYAPDKLDPPWQVARIAMKHGCMFALGSDAHYALHLKELPSGVKLARRAGVSRENLLNCKSYEQVRELCWRGQ
ncbi:MAG: PHP domain-containing protein [Caldisericia bacterium]|nr:PHP domain-containing protein [Caldisericia bacterium]